MGLLIDKEATKLMDAYFNEKARVESLEDYWVIKGQDYLSEPIFDWQEAFNMACRKTDEMNAIMNVVHSKTLERKPVKLPLIIEQLISLQ